MTEIERKFIQLVKGITELQWVRESLPAHSKNYESLKKKLQKQIQLKEFSEKELKAYQLEKDQNSLNSKMTIFNSNSNHQTVNNNRSYTNMIESVKFYENAIQQIQTQINQAEDMMDELNIEKRKLDDLCDQLHLLYEEVIIPDLEDSSYIFEQHLKRDVEQLAADIPNIKHKIEIYTLAQSKLYEARELIEKAMKSLPGASTFMDRQAIAASQNHQTTRSSNTLLSAKSISSAMFDPIKNADKIAQTSYQLVKEASEICDDVPLIPVAAQPKLKSGDVVILLTHYRGYRLKIEYILRTQLNPRLHAFENQLASTKYHHEQRLIEWIDHQIISLEAYLRTNGCLVNENLERELSRLRMGSRAAMAAVASEVSGRVTVDDALEITTASDQGVLPEYNSSSSGSSSRSRSSSNSTRSSNDNNTILSARCNDAANLPSYYRTTEQTTSDLPPPAYTR